MRVIAGTYRSRILKSLKGHALRPTSDRLRETLFNVLGPGVVGARFVDLYAGTGAIGIEALSRGASEVVFIENHAPAAALIRRNLESLGVRSAVTVLAVDALRGLEMLASFEKGNNRRSRLRRGRTESRPLSGRAERGYDYVFLDPPYAAAEDYTRVLQFLGSVDPGRAGVAEKVDRSAVAQKDDLLAPGAIVVAEHSCKFDSPEEAGALRRYRILKQGDAALSFYRRKGPMNEENTSSR